MSASKNTENNVNSRLREDTVWVINGLRLDEKCHCLFQVENVVHLEPKIIQLLAYLAARSGKPISREQILEEVWPGSIVSDESLTNAVNKIRKAFGDSSQNPQVVETIPKMGYRLVAKVSIEAVPTETSNIKRGKPWVIVVLVALVITGLLIVSTIQNKGGQKVVPDQEKVPLVDQELRIKQREHAEVSQGADVVYEEATPSILVLPFRHIGNHEEDDYFIDGITVDIITELSKLSNLLVMANQTSLNFKGKNISPQEAGRELGVGFVLDGSLRRAKDDLRVNAQLIDVTTGYTLWSERYDRKLVNIFDIQDEITENIVRELAVRLTTQEQVSLRTTARVNFQAYDLFLKGQDHSNRRTPEDLAEAIRNFEEAIKLDPTFARAYGAAAIAIARQYRAGTSPVPQEALDRALSLSKQAVNIDDSVPQVYWALSMVRLYRKEYSKAIEAVESALRLAPNYADGYGLLALIHNNQGNSEEALKNITHGMRLNPYYSFDYPYNVGRAYYLSGDYEKANEYLLKALQRNEAAMMPRLFLAASYVEQGNIEDAEWEAEQLQMDRVGISIAQLRHILPQKPILLEKLLGNLRAAGIPE
jgi:TolB-like protein/DNA-binding winged helix-turn-helix (wHTH) protein/Tfp pilus assembly protein PilF